MNEKLNTVLLLVVIVLLVFLFVRLQDGEGRFQPFGQSVAALDTRTGQACRAVKERGNRAIPTCMELATQ